MSSTAQHHRYLIVDDSPLSLKWLARILPSIGPCDVIEAGDGVAAVEKLASEGDRIDAIISDLRMPNMNGLELLKEVRMGRTGVVQHVPFFIVTGISERALAGLALGLDVDAFLARPPKMQALHRHLIRTSAERRVAKTAAEARAVYGAVDLSSTVLPGDDISAHPPDQAAPPLRQTTAVNGTAVAPDERLTPLEDVAEGAFLARSAVNGAGAVLVKAGEAMTASLKAVLMSYAEIDGSLAKVWVRGSPA